MRRRLVIAVIGIVAIVGLAIVFGAWWIVGTPGGARLVLDRIALAAGKGARIEGVEGRLGGALRIALIEVSRPDLYVRIDDVAMETEPLSWRRLLVHRLTAKRVEVRTASTGAAARIPVTFRAPYPITLDDGRIGEIHIGKLENGKPAGEDVVLRDVVVKGEGDNRRWTLREGVVRTQAGTLRLAGMVDASAPFALAADASFDGEVQAHALRATARVEGTLKRFVAKLDGAIAGGAGTGEATIEPFDARPIHALALHLRDIDLAAFGGLPRTRLTVDTSLAPRKNDFGGPVRIENALAGSFDEERLPFTSAQGIATLAPQRVALDEASIALLGGGAARGRVTLEHETVQASLKLENANLAALHHALQPTRASGSVSVTSEAGRQQFQVALRDARYQLDGRGTLAAGTLEVAALTLKQGAGVLDAKATLQVAGRREFHFEGRAQHVDPSAFVKAPPGDLSFTFVASGALADALSGDLVADLAASRYAGLPAAGHVHVAGDRHRIAAADVRVTLGESTLSARGSFGGRGDALDVTLHAPEVAPLARIAGIAAAGSVDAQARLVGTFAAPGGHVTLKGTNLRLPADIAVRELALDADAGVEAASPVRVALEAKGILHGKAPDTRAIAESLTAAIDGTRAAHHVKIDAALNRTQALAAALSGGLDDRALEWRGALDALRLSGQAAFALAAPAPLTVSARRIELGEATLRAEWGEAHLQVTRWTPQRFDLKGSTGAVAVSGLARALQLREIPRSTLVVSGAWDLHGADTLEGSVVVQRESGDLRVGDPAVDLGLEALTLRIDAARGKAKATVAIRGTRAGRIDGEASASIVRTARGMGLAPEAPVAGRFDLDVPSLEAFAAWLGPDAAMGGSMKAQIALSGTGASPQWSGGGRAENLRVREPQTGFEIDRGTLQLAVSERSIAIERFDASTPWHPSDQAKSELGISDATSGTISARGAIDLAAGTGTIRIHGEKVAVTQLQTRFVALSGDATLEGRKDGVLVTGTLATDAAWIGALATPLPTVSDDILVVRASEAPETRLRDRIHLDVRVALGANTRFTGRGLDTKLAGEVRLQGEPPALRATGAIRTVEGTYDAYGQRLQIEHGTLTFVGPLENPTLSVRALRRGLPVEAGVDVFGTASKPRARLVSIPEVPEPEKLSWLVLGRGPADVTQGDAATLVAAARAILGRGGGESDIVHRFGFDDVRIGRSDMTTALGVLPQNTVAGRTGSASAADVVSVGKRLGKDVYVLYEQGLGEAEGALRITWQITKRFQILVRGGYLPGADAVYRWTFR